MPRTSRLHTHRSTYTAILGVAILIITGFAVQRTFLLRDEQNRENLDRVRTELRVQIDSWTELNEDRVRDWIQDLSTRSDLLERESSLRAEFPWFEGVYIWEVNEDGSDFQHPLPQINEDIGSELATECMRKANDVGYQKSAEFLSEATTLYQNCAEASSQEKVIMSTVLADLWMREGRPQRAWTILQSASPVLDVPLSLADQIQVGDRDLVKRRQKAAAALNEMDKVKQSTQMLRDLFLEITAINGPQLEYLLPIAEDIYEKDLLDILETSEARTALRSIMRAKLRLKGYQNLTEYLATRISVPEGAQDEFVVLQGLYSDNRALYSGNQDLFFVMEMESKFVAVQVGVVPLIDNLMDSLASVSNQSETALIDGDGTVLRGLQDPDAVARAQVPIGTLFPRMSVTRDIDRPTSTTEIGWLAGQIAPVGIAVLLGFIAITGRLRADTKERELYDRQQAFIARDTHELKTPLAGIRVMAETLEMGAAKDEETSQVFLQKIIQEAERLGKRIDEVLTVARKPEVSARTPVAPHELAEEVVEHWLPRYQAVGARLETDLKPCAAIAADPALLRDALNNLLDNALKYRRVGIPGRCLIRTGEVGKHVIFEVTDNGIGVPIHMRRRIFDRFARVEGAGRGKAGGHGLGLSFAAEAVEAHGGLIECLDGFNGGTRFRMRLRRG